MTAVLDETAAATQVNPAQRLRTSMAGVRLSITNLSSNLGHYPHGNEVKKSRLLDRIEHCR